MKAILTAAVLLLAACDASPKADAAKLAGQLSGDAKGEAADNPQCALYSKAEIAALAGEPVEAGHNAASGLGCQWVASDGSGSTIVTVTTPDNHVVTSGAEGFRELPGVGKDGFVAGKPGGWTAGAVTGAKAVFVSIDSDKTSEASVIALLRQTLAKVKG